MRHTSRLAAITAALAGGAVAGAIGRGAQHDHHLPEGISDLPARQSVYGSVSALRYPNSTIISHNHKSQETQPTNPVRTHVHTVEVTEITTISQLVEDVTVTNLLKETAVVSKAGDAPYTTLMPSHEAQKSLHHIQSRPGYCPNGHCEPFSVIPNSVPAILPSSHEGNHHTALTTSQSIFVSTSVISDEHTTFTTEITFGLVPATSETAEKSSSSSLSESVTPKSTSDIPNITKVTESSAASSTNIPPGVTLHNGCSVAVGQPIQCPDSVSAPHFDLPSGYHDVDAVTELKQASAKSTTSEQMTTITIASTATDRTWTATYTRPVSTPPASLPEGCTSTPGQALYCPQSAQSTPPGTVLPRNVNNVRCDCSVDEWGMINCSPDQHTGEECATIITDVPPRAKRTPQAPTPSSVYPPWLSNTAAWPSGVTPGMAPAATPPASANCVNDLKDHFGIMTTPLDGKAHRPLDGKAHRRSFHDAGLINVEKKVALSQGSPLIMSLEHGALVDSLGRIGAIVANSQVQFDGPPQAGTIYDAGWSVCNPDGKGYRLAIGANMTFWSCGSGGFSNLYNSNIGGQCTEINLMIYDAEQAPSYGGPAAPTEYPSSVTGSVTTVLNERAVVTPSPTRYDNQWARKALINGKLRTFWDPFPVITESGTVYSLEALTAYVPHAMSKPTQAAPKRDVDNDIEVPINYELNTYTITYTAEGLAAPRVKTVTEAPYTYTAVASVAARGATPIPVMDSSSSSEDWQAFTSTVPATTVTTFLAGGIGWTTITEPERTYTSLYKTTEYVTTFTYTNAADQITETWTLTVEPPTFTTSSTQPGYIAARQISPTSTFTEIVSTAVTTVWVVPEPISSLVSAASETSATSMLPPSTESLVTSMPTTIATPPSETSSAPAESTVAMGNGANATEILGADKALLAFYAMALIAGLYAFCL